MTQDTSTLPPLEFLDEAARAAGFNLGWHGTLWPSAILICAQGSVIAHARTLAKLAALEAENAALLKENDRLDKCWHSKHTEQAQDRREAKKWFDRYQRLRQSLPSPPAQGDGA